MKRNISSITILAALVAAMTVASCKKDEPVVDPTATTPPPMSSEPAATTPAPTVPAAMTVTTVDMGTEVGADNRITVPGSSFAAGDTIHASVGTDGTVGGNLTATWTYQDGQVVDTQDKVVPAGAQTTDFSISKPDGWPAGQYKLEISSGGMVVQTREFDIQ
ncbi:MAG: DUF3244 domain-containing protein [Pseudomonadota bacterium]|nr:DUF3244 domain-containing protein [Pseudomonadota bacterium]